VNPGDFPSAELRIMSIWEPVAMLAVIAAAPETRAGKKQLVAERAAHWEKTASIMARFFALEEGSK
jgi:hypothetical protein